MNKICTSLEQSNKLIELGIDVYTADMYWKNGVSDKYIQCFFPIVCGDYQDGLDFDYDIPAWSLSALMNLMPNLGDKQPILTRGKLTDLWYCYYEDEFDTQTYDNPLDAAFEMVCWLKENGKI